MNTLREIIKQAQRELYCNTCHRSFGLDEIRFKGQLEKTILLQTVCMNNHPPTIMVFMAPFSGNLNLEPINHDDLLQFHKDITNYKGRLKDIIKQS